MTQVSFTSTIVDRQRMPFPVARACTALLAAASPAVAYAQDVFPGTQPGVDVGGSFSIGFEPSGAAWHLRLNRLLVVDDSGNLASVDSDGNALQVWPFGDDLEAVCVADPATPFVYLGLEDPDTIIEFNLESGLATRFFDLTPFLQGLPNKGLEALTFARMAGHPEGGLFYAGLQADGRVYEFELPITSSAVAVQVKHLSTLAPVPQEDDISGLDWDGASDTLYACFDGANLIAAFDRSGVVSKLWKLPGFNQEGIARRGCLLFVAQDSGEVLRYPNFPQLDACDSATVDLPSLSIGSGGTQTVDIDFGVGQANAIYFMLGTLTDTLPGVDVDGVHLPLQPDAYFFFTLGNPNSGPLGSSLGQLDAQGRASASIAIPPAASASLSGLTLYHSVALLGTSVRAASNPVPLSFGQ